MNPFSSPLDRPLSAIVPKKTVAVLAERFAITTVGDLLRHYPRRYDRMGRHTDLSVLREGEQATVLAQILRAHKRSSRRRGPGGRPLEIVEVIVTDGANQLDLAFFGSKQSWRLGQLTPGHWGLFAGKVSRFRSRLQLVHPHLELLGGDEELAAAVTGGYSPAAGSELIPIYPATQRLPSWEIARVVGMALDTLGGVVDPLPEHIRSRLELDGFAEALRAIHRPDTEKQARAARHRLAFDEAFALQLTLARRRAETTSRQATPRPARSDGLADAFNAALPFTLTDGQQEVIGALRAELAAEHPMHRLLQGEVGSGKTVCALLAMLQVVDNGGQAALLAPTEVLAAQHARSLRWLLGPYGRAGELDSAEPATSVALLTGSLPALARRTVLAQVADGTAGIVVGTHALLSEGVDFRDLGVVVVDEQHRFGVEQRDALRAKAERPPHLLVMTATPIPRTVAMTVYGDLEVSTLAELPAGRSAIRTHVVPVAEKPHFLARAWERIREEVVGGHQAYVVCPRIGVAGEAAENTEVTAEDIEDPTGEADSAEQASPGGGTERPRRPPLAVLDVAPMLVEGPLAGLRLGILHGCLPSEEKDSVMRAFAAGGLDVLVATTVVEVGVDVANATVMAILDADRFGISQLHQLRGRVGRGSSQGVCLLVTDMPAGSPARQRLDDVAGTLDGFALAELDLRQRREGEVLGATQSGRRRSVKLLDVLDQTHRTLIAEARSEAIALVADDPSLTRHPALAAAVDRTVSGDRAEYLEKG